ncbi:hypothetical protein VTJ49DRAFT_7280 [Mycothermus thermophilus]|uniref:Uncharacterized protein n=1 Tax=Humicola insolens TaxID=85995 RepID=A0ABR3VIT8_HUMIN
MKVPALSIACLIGGALSAPAPVPEEAQHMDMQMMPHEMAQMMPQMMPHQMTPEQMAQMMPQMMPHQMTPEQMAQMMPHMGAPMGMDMNAMMMGQQMDGMSFEEMVHQVASQVKVIQNLMNQSGDPNAMVEALMMPMMDIDRTLAVGVSRLNLGGLLGGAAGAKKGESFAIKLVRDLLKSIYDLLDGLLTRGLLGGLIDGVVGGLLGGVTGTVGGAVGGLLGGGVVGDVQAATEDQIPALVQDILRSVSEILPAAADIVGQVPVAAVQP